MTLSGLGFSAHPQLNQYNYRLTGVAMLFEGAMYCTLMVKRLCCAGFWPDLQYTDRSFEFTLERWQLYFVDVINQEFFLITGVYLANMVLFMDMYLTIFNPFQGDRARLKTVVTVFASCIFLIIGFEISFSLVGNNFSTALTGSSLLFIFPNTYFVLTSAIRLKQTGTNQHLRGLLMQRIFY